MSKKEISKELRFIKGFSSTSVNKICKEYNINRGNLIMNKVSKEKEQLVYNRLVAELTELINDICKSELNSYYGKCVTNELKKVDKNE